ncbi:MAG: AAA family ATPase [Methylococcaceae bacterium]|nr:AAA family ATPase [Methylococcaceae bacterium]
MQVKIPELALVLLLGPSGAGKSTFARRHFLPTEVISSDHCRAMICDDENDQEITADAFEIVHLLAAKRLKAGRFTVIDATNVQPRARKPLIALARQFHCPTVALVLDMPLWLCLERNAARGDRDIVEAIIRSQREQLHNSLHGLEQEGVRQIHVFRSPKELEDLAIGRRLLQVNKKRETGPFDLIGDIHGCFDELSALLDRLGYRVSRSGGGYETYHPDGRKLVFLGDLVDRGPKVVEVLRLVMEAVEAGMAFCVTGNHEVKLVKALRGRHVTMTHGLAESMKQLAGEDEGFRLKVAKFLDNLPHHQLFDEGRLVAAHAGLREEMQGRDSGRVREFCLYGEITGKFDEFGLPVRGDWAAGYQGRSLVVYGHTPITEPRRLNNTLCLDTGCVFGGKLTALRYPEQELVSVAALAQYFTLPRPLTASPQGGSG